MGEAACECSLQNAKAAEPVLPGNTRIPFEFGVADNATTSGTGVVDPDSNIVFTPAIGATLSALAQAKRKRASVDGNASNSSVLIT